jgi:hypothetical protein
MLQGNDEQLCAIPLEGAVLQIDDERQHLLMLLASCVRASSALEMSIGALSENRRCLLEADRVLAERRPEAERLSPRGPLPLPSAIIAASAL